MALRGRSRVSLALGLTFACIAAADELTPVRAFRVFDRATAPELPESIVVDLVQDRDGVLWVDTLGGLATYDGTSLRAVSDAQAPRGAALLVPRAAGGLYALSRQGLHVFDGRWAKLATDAPISSLAESDAATLWAVRANGLWTTPAAAIGSAWTPVTLPDSFGLPRSVFSDRNGGVYVASASRLMHCRDERCAPVATGFVPKHGSTALATRDGALWIGTWDGGLFAAAPDAIDWTPIDLGAWPSGGVRSLTEGRDGRVWVGGMARLCQGTLGGPWSCWGVENGLPSSAILSLLADREGTLWLGLNGRGVMQWVGQPWTHLTRWPNAALSAEGLDVVSVAPTHDGRGLLASVFGRGVLRWEPGRVQTWGREDGLVDDVRGLAEPEPGVVWAAARHGIYEKDGTGRFRRTLDVGEGFVSGFAKNPGGTWFAYTEARGVFARRAGGWQHAQDLESLAGGRSIRALGFTPSGALWLSTPAELVLRTANGAMERYPLGLERGGLDSVATLVEVGDELWAGGQGGVAVVRNGAWQRRPDSTTPGNVYFLRRAPDGTLWMGGSRGIVRVRDGAIARWDRSNGLVDDECNGAAVVMPAGTLYAATAGSLARFDPTVAIPAAPPLRVLWREPEAARTGTLERAAGERRVALGWSAPSLVPGTLWYETRLEDGAWSRAMHEPGLTLDSLPAGTTAVAVRARRDGEDAWSEPATLRIRVAPFWWETAAARAALGLGLLGLMLLAVQRAVRRAHARRAEALVHLRTDFVASASHELRTPIAQIRLFADMLRLGRARDDGERTDALETIHRATRRLEMLANNLVQLARGEAPPAPQRRSIDIAEALKEVAADLEPMAAARGAALRIDATPGLAADVDAESLLRIVSNLAENALKYGPRGQTVTLGAARDEALELMVEDEGPGIPEAERERVFHRFERLARDRNSAVSGTGLGLAVVREAVMQAGGTVHIEDGSKGGARVVVRLPQPEATP
jgi:signal transduction histidine kinase/ligand-binding sensor domain-containing protein